MAIVRYASEQIITKLREADVALAQETRGADVCRQLGVTRQTYCLWRKGDGGLKTGQVRQSMGKRIWREFQWKATG